MKTISEDKLIELLETLHAFNKLDQRMIDIIARVFELDNIDDLIKDNGITYNKD